MDGITGLGRRTNPFAYNRPSGLNVGHPLARAFVCTSSAKLDNFKCHQPVSNEAQHLGQKLVIRSLAKKRLQRGSFCYRVLGHG